MATIGLNMLYLVPGETGGMETYASMLIPALLQAGPSHSFIAFVNDEAISNGYCEQFGPALKLVHIKVRGRSRAKRTVAEQVHLPLAARRHGIDLLHSLGTTSPALTNAASVVTIHDVIYHHHHDAHRGIYTHGMRLLVPLSARRAKQVIAVSDGARQDLIDVLGLDPGKVTTVHSGVGQAASGPKTDADELRRKLGLGEGHIVLSVSAKRPHKNLMRLIEAFTSATEGDDAVLVIPGYSTGHEQELKVRARSLGISSRVKFPNWLDQPDLEGLYQAATCFIFPSLKEGFGLPILEAMQRGVPVACSNVPPLPEIAGDAALYFDPYNIDEVEEAVARLLKDSNECERLRDAGNKRAANFSWEKSAELTLSVYEQALNG